MKKDYLLLLVFLIVGAVGQDDSLTSHEQYMEAVNLLTGQATFDKINQTFQTVIHIVLKFQLAISITLFVVVLICIIFHERKTAIESKRVQYAKSLCYEITDDDPKPDLTIKNDAQKPGQTQIKDDVKKPEENKDNAEKTGAAGQIEEGKIIYLSGKASTTVEMEVPLLKIKIPNLFKIVLKVQVMEWRQKLCNCSGATKAEWADYNQSVVQDKYNNPLYWVIKPKSIYNKAVFLRKYPINDEILNQCYRFKKIKPLEHMDILHEIADQGQTVLSFDKHYIYLTPKSSLAETSSGKTIGTQRIIIELYETKNISFVGRYHEGKFLKFDTRQKEVVTQQTAKQAGLEAAKEALPPGVEPSQSDYTEEIPEIVEVKKIVSPFEDMITVFQKKFTKQEFFFRIWRNNFLVSGGIRLGLIVLWTLALFLFFMAVPTLKPLVPFYAKMINQSIFIEIAIYLMAVILLFFVVAIIVWLVCNRSMTIIVFTILIFVDLTGFFLLLMLHKSPATSPSNKLDLPHMLMNRF